MRLSLIVLLAVAATSCAGPRHVRLSFDDLRTLETCVIEADDQVERQNCVERLIPKNAR